jgi:hypothetical protein
MQCIFAYATGAYSYYLQSGLKHKFLILDTLQLDNILTSARMWETVVIFRSQRTDGNKYYDRHKEYIKGKQKDINWYHMEGKSK